MRLLDTIRHTIGAVRNQLRDSGTLLRRVGFLPTKTFIHENFHHYGDSFNVASAQEYTELAIKLYNDAKAQSGEGSHYSVIEVGYGRVAIDCNGEMRGIFSLEGKPLAFFRPDYRQLGFSSKQEELEAFRKGATFRGWHANS